MALFRAAIALAAFFAVGCVATHSANSGIGQLIETRDGRRGVWGVVVTVHDCRFSDQLTAAHLRIVEKKHGSDITALMIWSVSHDKTQLVIRFKDGMGDFGSGNSVTVHVARGALIGYDQANDPGWTISTDPT
jgi:hypothetical protein